MNIGNRKGYEEKKGKKIFRIKKSKRIPRKEIVIDVESDQKELNKKPRKIRKKKKRSRSKKKINKK